MTSKNANRMFALVALIFLFSFITTIVSGIVSINHYNRYLKQIEFLKEAERAATVDIATDALEKGIPFLKEHFANSMELRILQSNLDYLKQQPSQTLIPPRIKESISINADNIHYEFISNEPWLLVFAVSMGATGLLGISLLDQ